MIEFREIDYDEDIPEVVAVLNANLDTEHHLEDFIWKHCENPFGKSFGFLATYNNNIVGVRMFMRWEFLNDGRIVKALRTVDSCTDKLYRRKRIFSELTLWGLKSLKNEYDLIFSTPNSQSKPGNLKLGWKMVAEPTYYVGFMNLMKSSQEFQIISASDIEFNKEWNLRSSCQTRLSKDFIDWRYQSRKYKVAQFRGRGVLIYKLVKLKGIKTLVMVDFFGEEVNLSIMIRSIQRKVNAVALYFSNRRLYSNMDLLFKIRRGRQAVLGQNDVLQISEKIEFSEGDLEGTI